MIDTVKYEALKKEQSKWVDLVGVAKTARLRDRAQVKVDNLSKQISGLFRDEHNRNKSTK